MSNPYFQFKQFTIRHDRCAMKVGTDGVLLGSWTQIGDFRFKIEDCRFLDIGTGTGLIALMLAQRCPEAQIDAIDIDAAAVEQARENIAASPWCNRITVHHYSLQEWQNIKSQITNFKYNLIVSNPPYFVNSLKNPDKQRELARHADTLPYHELFSCAASLLAEDGTFAVILPAEAEAEVIEIGKGTKLYPCHITRVSTKPGLPAKRVLMAFTKEVCPPKEDTLTIESADSPRSTDYANLTADFYL